MALRVDEIADGNGPAVGRKSARKIGVQKQWLIRLTVVAVIVSACLAMRPAFERVPDLPDSFGHPAFLEFLILNAIGMIATVTLMALGFPNPSERRWLSIANWVLRIEAAFAVPLMGIVFYKFALAIIHS